MDKPLISLVSGTYNRIVSLQKMVQSFRDNLPLGLPYEIVLVDGGSTDGTIEWCKSQADVVLIEQGELRGAIIAFTDGAFTARGKYVLLSNDDVVYFPDSILPAIIHLEQTPKCGAVAFKDNRPLPGSYTDKDYKVLTFPQQVRGKLEYLPYAQVGLFRKWLGDYCHWWAGRENEMLKRGLVYGGDNMLSTYIWSFGYTVDVVDASRVHDSVMEDELRVINRERGKVNDDSSYYYNRWPSGAIVPDMPTIPQQDTQGARFLYLPIYEPGWTIQKHPVHGKRGLRDALARSHNKHGAQSLVYEIDYLGIPRDRLKDELITACKTFKPHFILTQIQSPIPLTVDILDAMKAACNHQCAIINWNGDQAIGGLYSREMLPILRRVDLQLITNLDVVPDYEREHIKYDYWQIGYEEPGDDLEAKLEAYYQSIGQPNPYQGYPDHPVVYLASLRSPERQAIAEIVRSFGGYVFTPGDQYGTLYDFVKAKYIYSHAKIAISDNGFTSRGFVSNRLFQALAAGGCVVLQQHVDGLDELTGLQHLEHYIEWTDLDGLAFAIEHVLKEWPAPQSVAKRGTSFVHEHFSFDAQVVKLFDLMRQHLSTTQQAIETVTLRYIGKSQTGAGGVPSVVYERPYEHKPGQTLIVHKRDAELLLKHSETWIEA